MSDYLWDKTGEPDAETERLENLLGQLRFQPTPFDLPAELPAKDFRAARTRNVLSWPRLAVAASITLAVLAGAWVALKQQTAATNEARPIAERNGKQSGAGDEQKRDETRGVVPSKGDETQGEQQAAGPRRPHVPDLADGRRPRRAVAPRFKRAESASAPKRRRNPVAPRAEPERREELALSDQEREAAEKVLYALRVTSENLNYARRQVHDAGRREDNR